MGIPSLIVAAMLLLISLSIFLRYYAAVLTNESFVRTWIPYKPRKPVPWNCWDFILLCVFYLLVMQFFSVFGSHVSLSTLIPNELQQELQQDISSRYELRDDHPLTQLIVLGNRLPAVFWTAFLAGVIVVPIGEEFLFRLIFQGLLENNERFARQLFGKRLFRAIPQGFWSISIQAVIFALLHYRSEKQEALPVETLLRMMLCLMIAYLVFLYGSIIYLVGIRGAKLSDLGVQVREIPGDCATGFMTAVMLIPPVLLFMLGIKTALKGIVPFSSLDPFPLFFFAVGLGVLYFRTHRIVPGIILHILLNGTSFTAVYLSVRFGIL